MTPNTHHIRLPLEDSKANYLDGFWQWVALMADDRYDLAALAIDRGKDPWDPQKLKKRITNFFGGSDPWYVVIPNDRLIGVINDNADFQLRTEDRPGWFMAQIPITTEPSNPKDDAIPLMGLAVSFFVNEVEGAYELDFEIFHA